MAQNDFKPFAIGSGANVTSQADWEALSALVNGFQSGKASSAQVNKAIRQASFISAALAQFVSDKNGADVLDDGDLPGFVTDFISAVAVQSLTRTNPFADIKADGTVNTALSNLGLGTAAKKDIGTDTGQVPDMSSFTYTTTGTGIVIRLPGGIIIQMDVGTTDSNGFYSVNMGVAMSSYQVFAVEGHVSGWTASGGEYQLLTVYGAEKVDASSFNVRSATWRSSDHNFIAQSTVFNWIAIGRI